MFSTRTIKVWNKTVIINDAPNDVTDEQLVEWTKKRLILDGLVKMQDSAS